MSLTPEDKKDVKGAMGKAIANKVSRVTKDRSSRKEDAHAFGDVMRASGFLGGEKKKQSHTTAFGIDHSKSSAKNKAIHAKMGGNKRSDIGVPRSKWGPKTGNWMKILPGDRD